MLFVALPNLKQLQRIEHYLHIYFHVIRVSLRQITKKSHLCAMHKNMVMSGIFRHKHLLDNYCKWHIELVKITDVLKLKNRNKKPMGTYNSPVVMFNKTRI